jgi:hypothetical protein
MRPTTAENPPLADPLNANRFSTDPHTASLLNMDCHNTARLDAVLRDTDPHSICCRDTDPHSICRRNTDLCTDGLCGTNLCNTDHCNAGHHNAESFKLLLEGISSEGDNQVMETGIADFEASKTGEENHSMHKKRSPVKMKFADAECSARPQSERNRCWAQWLLPTGQRRSCE